MYKSYKKNQQGAPMLDQGSMRIFYAHSGLKYDKPDDFVALNDETHKNFPPTYLVACEFDVLRDDAYSMEVALKKIGLPIKLD